MKVIDVIRRMTTIRTVSTGMKEELSRVSGRFDKEKVLNNLEKISELAREVELEMRKIS